MFNILSSIQRRTQRSASRKYLTSLLETESEYIGCPICGSGDECHEVLATEERHRLPLQTVQCRNDGMVFFNPMPTTEFLIDLYANHYQQFHRGRT